MTMAEIDRLRCTSTDLLEKVRLLRRSGSLALYEATELQAARERVERALQQWWRQGCRE